MKLDSNQKDALKVLKSIAVGECGDYNLVYMKGFATIAYARNFKNSKMISVSVSYFDQNECDRYRKSTGAYFALTRLILNESVQLPLGNYDDNVIAEILVDMFDIG